MANTGLRPDEILEIEVRGKRGVGYCKSMPGAVRPFERLRDRSRPVADAPDDNSDTVGGAAEAYGQALPERIQEDV